MAGGKDFEIGKSVAVPPLPTPFPDRRPGSVVVCCAATEAADDHDGVGGAQQGGSKRSEECAPAGRGVAVVVGGGLVGLVRGRLGGEAIHARSRFIDGDLVSVSMGRDTE